MRNASDEPPTKMEMLGAEFHWTNVTTERGLKVVHIESVVSCMPHHVGMARFVPSVVHTVP